MIPRGIVVWCLASALLAGCTIVPITGRHQLSLVPQSDLIGMAAQDYELHVHILDEPERADEFLSLLDASALQRSCRRFCLRPMRWSCACRSRTRRGAHRRE